MEDSELVLDATKDNQRLIDDYKEGIENQLKSKLNELQREGDSKVSLASEKCKYFNIPGSFNNQSYLLRNEMFSVTDALSNIKKADAKLISLSAAAVKRQNAFDKWNDTLASKLQNLKDKIAEARNTADGVMAMFSLNLPAILTLSTLWSHVRGWPVQAVVRGTPMGVRRVCLINRIGAFPHAEYAERLNLNAERVKAKNVMKSSLVVLNGI